MAAPPFLTIVGVTGLRGQVKSEAVGRRWGWDVSQRVLCIQEGGAPGGGWGRRDTSAKASGSGVERTESSYEEGGVQVCVCLCKGMCADLSHCTVTGGASP